MSGADKTQSELLLELIDNYLRQLAPHAQTREAAQLLRSASDEIKRLAPFESRAALLPCEAKRDDLSISRTLVAANKFKAGQIVTRDGSDRQYVLDVDDDFYCMRVLCVEPPMPAWCEKGDIDSNLTRRYTLCSEAEQLPEGWRYCEFCCCKTNAKLRRCCDKGYQKDKGA